MEDKKLKSLLFMIATGHTTPPEPETHTTLILRKTAFEALLHLGYEIPQEFIEEFLIPVGATYQKKEA